MKPVKSLKILGIDPCIARMGWGVIEEARDEMEDVSEYYMNAA